MNTIPPNAKNDAKHDDHRDADSGHDDKTKGPDDKKVRTDSSSEVDKDEDMDNVVSQRIVR